MKDEELAEEHAEHNQGKYTSEFGNLYHAYLTGEGLKEYVNNVTKVIDEAKQEILRLVNKNVKLEQQLVKAKELLKRGYNNYIYLEPLRSEIEQFLKEVDK